jgi:opacity protein-like surface antigen
VRYQFTPDVAGKRIIAKAPVLKAPIVERINWTGFYIGAFSGMDYGHGHWGYLGGTVDPRVAGYLGGGQVGYNYQLDQWVLGVEGDIGGTNTHGAVACNTLSVNGFIPATMFELTCSTRATWLATFTARLGYAWDRTLFYVKGGGAATNETFTASCNFGPLNAPGTNCTNAVGAFTNGFSAGDNRWGWTVGYGTEFALTRNWSAKAEWDYLSFDNHNLTASDGSTINAELRVSEVKVGVNYRFQ